MMSPQEAIEFLRSGEVPAGKSAACMFEAIASVIEDQQREIEQLWNDVAVWRGRAQR